MHCEKEWYIRWKWGKVYLIHMYLSNEILDKGTLHCLQDLKKHNFLWLLWNSISRRIYYRAICLLIFLFYHNYFVKRNLIKFCQNIFEWFFVKGAFTNYIGLQKGEGGSWNDTVSICRKSSIRGRPLIQVQLYL